MKFLLISPKNRTVYNFRGDLIKDIISQGYEVIVTGPDHKDLNKVLKLGVKFECIPLYKAGLNIFHDIKYILKLYKIIKKHKPDIVLGYTIKPVTYGTIISKIAGVKNINSMITGAGYVFTSKTLKAKIIRLFAKTLYYIAFKCTDTIIFQNPDDMKNFIKKPGKKHKLINGSGVNMQKFTPAEYPKTLTFFMLSRILYSKGVNEYLQASKIIKNKYPHIRFILLGALEDLPDAIPPEIFHKYSDTIEYYEETENIIQYYRQSSVYVLPSYAEGIPRTVLEAMAMARPIITTDAPGCRETVINNHNGFLIPVKDIKALADKMEYFISNPHRIPEMGQKSHKLCLEKFEVGKINQNMLKYMNIIDS